MDFPIDSIINAYNEHCYPKSVGAGAGTSPRTTTHIEQMRPAGGVQVVFWETVRIKEKKRASATRVHWRGSELDEEKRNRKATMQWEALKAGGSF